MLVGMFSEYRSIHDFIVGGQVAGSEFGESISSTNSLAESVGSVGTVYIQPEDMFNRLTKISIYTPCELLSRWLRYWTRLMRWGHRSKPALLGNTQHTAEEYSILGVVEKH